ncbi:MAG: CRISPR-associated protein Cas4 [Firmicutes bacterium]|nr:CRISPR-associated protein Cas4 [Bacillota bacterium]
MKNVYHEDDYLQLSAIQHFAFCPRQWALIHVEQQWKENIYTYQGRELHQRTDDPSFTEKRGDLLITRAVPISSKKLGLNGIADVIEFHRVENNGVKLEGYGGQWLPVPVEYKLGNPKPTNCDILQLCAQAICLEEAFEIKLEFGYIYYGRSRRRLDVSLNSELKAETYRVALEMHQVFASGITPEPIVTKACEKCSLNELCLPQIAFRRSVKCYLESALDE